MLQTQMLTGPNQRATTVNKTRFYKNKCRLLKRRKEQSDDTQNNPRNENSGANISLPNNNTIENNNNNNYKNSNRAEKSHKLFIHPVRHAGKQTTEQRNATMEPIQAIDRLPGTEDQKDRIRSKKKPIKTTRKKLLRLQPRI